MTDARYPERWLNDRRVVRLSDGAHRLHVVALAWSAANRTDGAIEGADLLLMPGVDPEQTVELVSSGLWQRTGDGWQVVDFAETQTTSAQLDQLADARKRESERRAARRASHHEPSTGVPPDIPPDTSGTTAVRPDVRPDSARTGQDRPGQAKALYTEGDQRASGDVSADETTMLPRACAGCGTDLEYLESRRRGRCSRCQLNRVAS